MPSRRPEAARTPGPPAQASVRPRAPAPAQVSRAGSASGRRGRSRHAPDSLTAPFLDPSVVAGEQDLGDLPAAKCGRPRVVRVLDPTVERVREALDLTRALGERSRQ